MSGLLGEIRRLNSLGNRDLAEPFAGGAGASLCLLYLEEAPRIHINDADRAIHDFWWTILNRPQQFFALLSRTRVNMAEWRRQRDVYRTRGQVSRLRRGFSAFYLNRCNRSGIIVNGGPIGGVKQTGKWKLGARYNKPALRSRLEKVAEYRDRISVSDCDGIEFIDSLDSGSVMFFIDPPYYHRGRTLYLSDLDAEYHADLAARLKATPDAAWVLTYDNCSEVRELYEDWATVRPFQLRYTATERREGCEVLIVPKWMQLPVHQPSAALSW